MNSLSSSYTPFVHTLINIDRNGLRFACLITALVVYAVFGSPTPDHPGLVEGIIAALLIAAAGIPSLNPDLAQPVWRAAGQLLLLFGLSVPVMTGVMSGQPPSLILRDIVPFLFLLLPLFVYDLCARPVFVERLIMAMLLIGLAFGVRALMGTVQSWFYVAENTELYYLANAPTVLFAALFLLGVGGHKIVKSFSLKGFALVVLALLAILPLALTLQRASLGLVMLNTLVLLVAAFFAYPRRTCVLMAFVILALWPFWDGLAMYAGMLEHKTHVVGLNMRWQELQAVWAEIAVSPGKLVFGTGWGGTFESPAVAGIRVNYTHSLLTSMLLKTGLAGFILVILYLYGFLQRLRPLLGTKPVLALALAAPLVIDVFLYASFKSLDFGLILLLVVAASSGVREVASRRWLLY